MGHATSLCNLLRSAKFRGTPACLPEYIFLRKAETAVSACACASAHHRNDLNGDFCRRVLFPGPGSSVASSSSRLVSGSESRLASIVVVGEGGGAPVHLVLFLLRPPLENGSISQLSIDQHEILMAKSCARARRERERVSRNSLEGPKGIPLSFASVRPHAWARATKASNTASAVSGRANAGGQAAMWCIMC